MRKVVRGVFTLGMVLATISSVSADQKIQDDLVVVGSECLGVDCSTGENFGFDTLRLKENNLRIHFVDTSSAGSFPSEDWQITINDSLNGGENYFRIENTTHNTKPFSVIGNAPDNSLYINKSGNVGLGTTTPQTKLNLKTGNTPTIRLEQDGSQGWSAQKWDIAANESAFFIRDFTNGAKLPLFIRSGAPAHSLSINYDGKLGLGLSGNDAAYAVEIKNAVPKIKLGNSSRDGWIVDGAGDFSIAYAPYGYETPVLNIAQNAPSNSLSIGTGAISFGSPVDMNSSLSVGGTLTVTGNIISLGSVFNASDKNLKENIVKVKDSDILNKVDSLDISFWNYKTEDKTKRHIGPMAQEFYKIFKVGVDNKHISSLDAAAVAIASVKALNEKLKAKDKEIAALQAQVKELKNVQDRMAKIEALLQQNRTIAMQSKEERMLAKKYRDSEDAPMIEKSDEEVQTKEHDPYLYNGRDRKSDSK